MPNTLYKVWAWGPPVSSGVTDACHVGVTAVAKKSSADSPYIVANEVVCNAIARCLFLPCPPGALVDRNGEPWFISLNFNMAGQSLPPADANSVATMFPRLSWGIILFDALMMNGDRHDENISFDTSSNKVQIFDHSHAFVQDGGDISAFLAANEHNIHIHAHCLAQEISEFDGLDFWLARIRQIPDYFIEETIEAAATVGLPPAHKAECVDFFKRRRTDLDRIVRSHMGHFPRLPSV